MKAITTTDLRIRCVLVAIIYGYLVGTLFGFMADGPISPDMARHLTEMPTPAPSSQSSPTAKVYPTIDNWADYNALHDGDFYWSRGHLFKKGIKGRWALDAESNPYPLQPLEPLTSPTPVPSPTPTLFTLPDVPPFIWVLVYVGLIALAIGCLWHMWRWVMGKPKPAPANNPKPPKKKPVVYHDYAQFQAALKINHLEHEAFDRYETARLEVLKKAVKDKTPVGSFVAICAVIAGFYLGRGHHYSHQSRLAGSRAQRARAGVPSAMKVTAPLKAAVGIVILALAGCATDYQSQGFTGGYTDLMTAPDEAVVTFHGNGYTPVERVGAMAALRRAEITLQHGYRYFVLVNAANVSGSSSFTTPGVANTYGSAYGFGNFATGSATTIVTPPQTHTFFKPGIQMVIKMSNDERSLETIGLVINGQRARPKDAAFLSQSLRQYLGVKGNT